MSAVPPLDEKTHWFLQVVTRGLMGDPGYLEKSGYPAEIKDFLTGRVGKVDFSKLDMTALDMPAEIQALYVDLKEQRSSFPANDSAEKMAYFRVATSLLEKLMTLLERANNVRQVGQFYSMVLSTMEEFLEPTQITKLRARLVEFGV